MVIKSIYYYSYYCLQNCVLHEIDWTILTFLNQLQHKSLTEGQTNKQTLSLKKLCFIRWEKVWFYKYLLIRNNWWKVPGWKTSFNTKKNKYM